MQKKKLKKKESLPLDDVSAPLKVEFTFVFLEKTAFLPKKLKTGAKRQKE
jgi:hypothetical protein